MHFTIITPSFNQLDYLKRCVASVADQATNGAYGNEQLAVSHGKPARVQKPDANGLPKSQISVHHRIQDGGSTDATREFLAEHLANSQKLIANGYTFSHESAPDEGMYDAINKGVDCSLRFEGRSLQSNSGEQITECIQREEKQITTNSTLQTANHKDSVVAWLNCDEQYLPGTLASVENFLNEHPDVDILFGGMLMVNEQGKLLACRKAMPMRRLFLKASYLYNFSCAMFFRRSLWDKLGGFDVAFKNAGDEDWVRRALKSGAQTAVMNAYLSTFTYAKENLSSDPDALDEHERLKAGNSGLVNRLRIPINLLRLSEKFLRGGVRQSGPVEYEMYVSDFDERTRFVCENPTCRWPGESKPYLFQHRLRSKQ